jgi:hypothetical protein
MAVGAIDLMMMTFVLYATATASDTTAANLLWGAGTGIQLTCLFIMSRLLSFSLLCTAILFLFSFLLHSSTNSQSPPLLDDEKSRLLISWRLTSEDRSGSWAGRGSLNRTSSGHLRPTSSRVS